MSGDIDLGHGHTMRFVRWVPDDLPANRERYGVPLPDVQRAGLIVTHLAKDGSECESVIHFDLPEMAKAGLRDHVWKIEQWEPLTISPSLSCKACGDHGFIRNGKWVPAWG